MNPYSLLQKLGRRKIYFARSTVPSIYTVVSLGTVFAVTLIGFRCLPDLFFELKTTDISPLSPGNIASLGNFGTVQPQVDFAPSMTKGAVPVLVNLKTCSTLSPD